MINRDSSLNNNLREEELFIKKIIENSKDLDEEFQEIINKNFWDLI